MPMDSKDKKIIKNKHFISSLEFAIVGIRTVFKEERNMRTHIFLGSLAIIFGFLFHLSVWEWLWLFLVIFCVLFAEIMNTVFENVVDMVTNYHFHPIGKKVKDMAAGAVLLTALFAIIVGSIIFLPKIWDRLNQLL